MKHLECCQAHNQYSIKGSTAIIITPNPGGSRLLQLRPGSPPKQSQFLEQCPPWLPDPCWSSVWAYSTAPWPVSVGWTDGKGKHGGLLKPLESLAGCQGMARGYEHAQRQAWGKFQAHSHVSALSMSPLHPAIHPPCRWTDFQSRAWGISRWWTPFQQQLRWSDVRMWPVTQEFCSVLS